MYRKLSHQISCAAFNPLLLRSRARGGAKRSLSAQLNQTADSDSASIDSSQDDELSSGAAKKPRATAASSKKLSSALADFDEADEDTLETSR